MDSAALKKWSLWGALLLLTLILVWQAPAPDRTEVVEASRHHTEIDERRLANTRGDTTGAEIKLNPRKKGGETVDLFSVPITSAPKQVARPVVIKPVAPQAPKTVALPFNYIGMFESDQTTTLFLMEGSRLHLVQEGETINDEFRLQRIDRSANELEWLLLPLNETRKMSMDR